MRYLIALLLLTLSAVCTPNELILQSGTPLAARERHCGGGPVANVRQNLAISFAPPIGGSDLKLRMKVQDLPVRKGEPLIGALIAQGGTPPYSAFTILSGSLPTGISLDTGTGLLSGTPTVVGHYSFLAQVQDSALGVYKCTLTIDVLPQLAVVAGTPTPGENDYAYEYDFRISGATGAVTWALTGGSLPTGLSLGSDGVLSGAPTASFGDYVFTATATDGGSGDALDVHTKVTIYLAISGVAVFPPGSNFVINAPATIVPTGEYAGGVKPLKFSFPSGLPSWATVVPLNPDALFGTSTLVITGVPDTLGTFTIPYEVTDAIGATKSGKQFSFHVIDPVAGPTGATSDHIALFDGVTGKIIKDSGIPISSLGTAYTGDGATIEINSANVISVIGGTGGATHANVPTSVTLSHTVNRYTAGSVAGTTPASPADFDELEIAIEDASFTGCSLVANAGQTVNLGASFLFDVGILPCVFRFRYNTAATNWFPLYYRIGTL